MPTLFALIPALLLSQPQNAGFDPARLDAVKQRLDQAVEKSEVAGVVVRVSRHGKVVFHQAAGYANLDPRSPMRDDTVFQVMSMTKPITAIAVVMCAERGLLNLDDPVSRYIPKFAKLQIKTADGTEPLRAAVTIRHLLTHTSGLSGNDPGGLSDEAKAKLTLAEYTEHFGSDPLESAPGTAIGYSGPGFAALGRIVEVASGQSFADFLEKNLFRPLDMKDTSFFARNDYQTRLAHLFTREEERWVRSNSDPMRPGAKLANPAGGLYSTAEDMAKVIECLLAGGVYRGTRIVSPASVIALTNLQSGALMNDRSDAQGYALGFSVVRSAAGTVALKSIGAFGHTGAYGTEFWGDPHTGVAVVFMAQTFNDRVRKSFNTMLNAAFIGP